MPSIEQDDGRQSRINAIDGHVPQDGDDLLIEAVVNAIFRGLTLTTIGVAGDIILGDSTLRAVYPKFNRKENLGIPVTNEFLNLFLGGAIRQSPTSISSNTTLDDTHGEVLCDVTGGSITVTLPAAASTFGNYTVKNASTSDNTVTVSGSENIDEGPSVVLSTHEVATFVSDLTEWWLV